MTPKTPMPSMMRLVAIGRRIKTSEIFISADSIEDYPHRSVRAYLLSQVLLTSNFLLLTSLHLRNGAVKTEHHVQIGPVKFRTHGLLDVGAGLLLDIQLVHPVAELQRAVAKLAHLRLARDVAVTGDD